MGFFDINFLNKSFHNAMLSLILEVHSTQTNTGGRMGKLVGRVGEQGNGMYFSSSKGRKAKLECLD